MEILAPTVTGPGGAPPSRCRHAAVALPASTQASCSRYFRGQELAEDGAIVAVHGGYDTTRIYGGSELLLLWVSKDGSAVRWGAVATAGSPPPPCFHHTLVARTRSPELVMVGGECSHEQLGQAPDDPGALAAMPRDVVFTLWLPSMVWTARRTSFEPTCSHNPGDRCLHACALRPRADADGGADEELVVVGGITREGVDEMVPYVLHLGTYIWRRPPYAHVFKHSRPRGRHRFAAAAVGRFLVVNGGCERRGWLQDTAVLDLHRLAWRPPPRIQSEPLRRQAAAGHTLAGLVAFGGCERGSFGISPVARMDVLLFGEAEGGQSDGPGAAVPAPASPQVAQSRGGIAQDGAAAVVQVPPAASGQGALDAAAAVPPPVASMYDQLFSAFAARCAAHFVHNDASTSSGEGSFNTSDWVDGRSEESDAGNSGVQPSRAATAPAPPDTERDGSGPSGSGGSGSGEATDTLQQDGSCGSCDELPGASESSDQN